MCVLLQRKVVERIPRYEMQLSPRYVTQQQQATSCYDVDSAVLFVRVFTVRRSII